ncbi:hypothetical protein ACO2Q2_12090 [Dyella sp. KRB-257]|uniref:hypothetical protein n=1 Tax=Dyella sp. KRB-257 TaxID=3400915 RepID=UPI003C053EAE
MSPTVRSNPERFVESDIVDKVSWKRRGSRNDSCEIRQWPAAALAVHYGMRAVQGRLAGFEAQI